MLRTKELDFDNPRRSDQLVATDIIRARIEMIEDEKARRVLHTLYNAFISTLNHFHERARNG